MNVQQLANQIVGNYNLKDIFNVWSNLPQEDKDKILNLAKTFDPEDLKKGINPETLRNIYNKIPQQDKQEVLNLVSKYLPSQLSKLPKYVPTSFQSYLNLNN
jgi:response regulator of citrate/malate metabolism